MERSGWKRGQGLGSSQSGIAEALEAEDAQDVHTKYGVGFVTNSFELHSTSSTED